jgi:hypothetical protein
MIEFLQRFAAAAFAASITLSTVWSLAELGYPSPGGPAARSAPA